MIQYFLLIFLFFNNMIFPKIFHNSLMSRTCISGVEIGQSLGGSSKSPTGSALIAAKRVEYAR
jgi:hypothetical protein